MNTKDKIKTSIIRHDTLNRDGSQYSYELHVKESPRVASYRIPLYSISVRMTDPEGNTTEASLADVFSDQGKAVVFYDKLVRHLATPLNLHYILEDEIS